MTQAIERDAIYRRRRFPCDVIETCVRWYLTYRLSYRDLVSLMAERDVHLTHTTIMRWVFRFVPEYEERWNRRAKPVGSSWRVDEIFIHTRSKMGYLYRAVDKDGKSVDSLFQVGGGIAAAMAFFRHFRRTSRWRVSLADTNPLPRADRFGTTQSELSRTRFCPSDTHPRLPSAGALSRWRMRATSTLVSS